MRVQAEDNHRNFIKVAMYNTNKNKEMNKRQNKIEQERLYIACLYLSILKKEEKCKRFLDGNVSMFKEPKNHECDIELKPVSSFIKKG